MLSRTSSLLQTIPLKSKSLFQRIEMSSSKHSTQHKEVVAKSNPKVLVPIATGSEELEAVTIVDTLVRGGADVTLAAVNTLTLQVVCSRGVNLVADVFITDCVDKKWDMIVCPGGMPGAQHLHEDASLQTLITAQIRANKYVGAICAAPAVVLSSGAHFNCKDKRMTCYPAAKFTSLLNNYSAEKVVVDGNVVTSQGPGTALEFSLALVELLCGSEKAVQVRKDMVA